MKVILQKDVKDLGKVGDLGERVRGICSKFSLSKEVGLRSH
jgi:ribosomal protein L9